MARKIFNLQNDLLVLFGIYYAIRFIYTKEIYIHDVFGNKVNTLHLLILTIVLVAIDRARDKKTRNKINKVMYQNAYDKKKRISVFIIESLSKTEENPFC